jgi:hypothetical protein
MAKTIPMRTWCSVGQTVRSPSPKLAPTTLRLERQTPTVRGVCGRRDPTSVDGKKGTRVLGKAGWSVGVALGVLASEGSEGGCDAPEPKPMAAPCNWEDDGIQLPNPATGECANDESLVEKPMKAMPGATAPAVRSMSSSTGRTPPGRVSGSSGSFHSARGGALI